MAELNHTPIPWRVREHPEDEGQFFVEGRVTQDHPYFGHSSGGVEIMSDEDYPRKRDDASVISTAPEGYALAREIVSLDIHTPSPGDWHRLWMMAKAIQIKIEERQGRL